MDVKYINPFLTSIHDVFEMMLDIPFQLGKPKVKAEPVPLHEVSGIIGLSGTVTGSVVINLSEDAAIKLASVLSGEELTEVDEDCVDAVGEIANMIVGGAKKDFPGEGNSISVPSVITGKHHVRYPRGIPIISIPCEVPMGNMTVDVALKEVAVTAGTDQ